MNRKSLFRLLIIGQILLTGSTMFAQKQEFKTNIGYGIWESFHGGLDLRLKNYSIGIDIGTSFKTLPFDHKYYSLVMDNAYFWGKVNKYDIKSWYFDARLIYWNSFEPNTTWKVLQICPSIGRELNITKSAGINLDFGPAILLHANRKDDNGEKVGWIYPIYPEIRIELFYRFKK